MKQLLVELSVLLHQTSVVSTIWFHLEREGWRGGTMEGGRKRGKGEEKGRGRRGVRNSGKDRDREREGGRKKERYSPRKAVKIQVSYT